MRRPQCYNQPYFFGAGFKRERPDAMWERHQSHEVTSAATTLSMIQQWRWWRSRRLWSWPLWPPIWTQRTQQSEKRQPRDNGRTREAPQEQRASSNDVKKSMSAMQWASTQGKGWLQQLQATAAQQRAVMTRATTTTKKRLQVAKKKARTTTSMTILPWRWLHLPKRQRQPVVLFLESCTRSSSLTTTLMPFLPRRRVFWVTVRPFGHLTVCASKKGVRQKLVWSKII